MSNSSRPGFGPVHSADLMTALGPAPVREYRLGEVNGTGTAGESVASRVAERLRAPVDFPGLTEALVPGDRVALAIDPGLPERLEVIRGVLEALQPLEIERVDLVLWEESSDAVLEELRHAFGGNVSVSRHRSADRGCLSYLAADAAALPIYFNRLLVDADFVLPVAAQRRLDQLDRQDPSGLFPQFADSATRQRYLQSLATDRRSIEPAEVDWLLGTQLMVRVTPGPRGGVGDVVAATPAGIATRNGIGGRSTEEFPPPSALVVAVLDGDWSQQTWANACRALAAASGHVTPGGTIVLWSGLSEPPPPRLATLIDRDQPDDLESGQKAEAETPLGWEGQDDERGDRPDSAEEASFPAWDLAEEMAPTLRRVLAEHRVLLHSQVDRESVETLSLGVVDDPSELRRVSGSFDSVGLLPAAQFAGGSLHASGTAASS